MTPITTERLSLRPYVRADFDAYAAMMASARADMLGGPYDAGSAWKCFATDASSYALSGYGCFTIWHQDTRAGFAGVIHPPEFPEPEMGWGLYDGFEGRGFATEAATAILAQIFAQTDRDSFVSYIAPANARSIAVATRIGGKIDPAGVCPAGWGSLVYRHTRPEIMQ